MGVEPKIGGFYPQNGWFISCSNPIKMDDLGSKKTLFLVQHPYTSCMFQGIFPVFHDLNSWIHEVMATTEAPGMPGQKVTAISILGKFEIYMKKHEVRKHIYIYNIYI